MKNIIYDMDIVYFWRSNPSSIGKWIMAEIGTLQTYNNDDNEIVFQWNWYDQFLIWFVVPYWSMPH